MVDQSDARLLLHILHVPPHPLELISILPQIPGEVALQPLEISFQWGIGVTEKNLLVLRGHSLLLDQRTLRNLFVQYCTIKKKDQQ